MGQGSHQAGLERSPGQPRKENEHSELYPSGELLRDPGSRRIPQTERKVSQVVITTVSIFETVVQKCVEGRFWYKTTANLRNSRSFVPRVISSNLL